MSGKWNLALMAASLGALLAGMAMAQETERAESRLRQRAGQARAQADQGQVCLASKVHGMTVKEQSGQAYGQIQDLVIDAQGQVRYLAISAQGGQQAGNRPAAEQPQQRAQTSTGQLTLIPWQAAEFHEGATPQQSYVTLNIEAARLQQAPTFTVQQLTAKEGQQQWMAQVNQFFGQQRGAARPQFDRERGEDDAQQRQQNRNQQQDN